MQATVIDANRLQMSQVSGLTDIKLIKVIFICVAVRYKEGVYKAPASNMHQCLLL